MQSGTRSARSRPIAIALFVAALGLLAWWGAGSRPDASAKGGQAGLERGPVELAAAEVAMAERRSLVRRLPVSGNIASMLKTTLKSRVPGEVLEVNVREGEAVKAGDVLARIDTRSLEAQVASARAALEKSSADLEIARLNHANSVRLFEKKVLAQNELDTKKSLFDAAAAARKLSAAQLRLAEIALEDALVLAPFDAVIARRYQDPGGKVSPDTPLFEVVDLTHMELRAAAPAAEIPAVRPGQIARVRVDGYGNEEFSARLERVNPSAEQGSRLVLLYLALDNTDGRLRDGMFAQGWLLVEQTEPVVAVPATAILNEAGLDYVMLIEDGRLQRRPVRLGTVATEDGWVEVREGLVAGDRLLAVRMASLEPGTPVLLPPPAVQGGAG